MKRFVTYIYGYEDAKKGSNVGFAKIEIRGEDVRLEIHLRGIYGGVGKCQVYLFWLEEGDMVGATVGELKTANGSGDFAVAMKAGSIGGSLRSVYDMDGLCIIGGDDRLFLSRWKDGSMPEVTRERFRIWEMPQDSKTTQPDKKQTETAAKKPSAPSNTSQTTVKMEKIVEAKPVEGKNPSEEQEDLSAMEIPMRNVFPRYDWLSIWKQLQKAHAVFTPFEDKEILCVQIELKDLRELPKRYWYLGNNSFLLHGFFNYRYIIIGNIEKDRWFIGVPGIYQHQERVMAAIFGFPEFIPAAIAGQNLGMEEPVNHFGYWYRFIEE